jgi:CheY-like chemotaxis protein
MEAKPKIWLVEGHSDRRDLMLMAFEHIGAAQEALFLNSGRELLERLDTSEEEDYPALIVLDYDGEEGGGQELLAQIKDNPFTRTIPVLIYTSLITPTLRDRLRGSGALMILEKGEDLVRLE